MANKSTMSVVGRFVGGHPWLSVGLVAVVLLFGFSGYKWHQRALKADEQRERQATIAASAARRQAIAANEEKRRAKCTTGIGPVMQEARAALAKDDPNGALQVLAACNGLMVDPAALALKKEADAASDLRMQRLRQIFDAEVAKAAKADLARRKKEGVSIGMTKQEVLESSWGRPRKVNSTHTALGVREQWVYDGGYLYFTNEVLTAVQN